MKQSTLLGCASLLLLGGCALAPKPAPQTSQPTPPAPTREQAQVAKPTNNATAKPGRQGGLTSELVYQTLAGEIAAQRGAPREAFEHAMRAALESRDPGAAERATQLALQANLVDQALRATQFWIELAPDSLKAEQIAALLYLRQKELEQAVRHLQAVTRIANANGQPGYIHAAAIAEKIGPPQQALAVMQRVVAPHRDDPEAFYALALTANNAKQYAQAEQAMRRALKLKPGWPKGLLLLSRTLLLQGDKAAGLKVLSQAVASRPKDFELRLTYARMLVETQQLEAALAQFQILHQAQSDNPDIIYALGVIATELKRYDSAQGQFQRLLELGEKTDEAHYHLGFIAEQRKDQAAALDHYRRVNGSNRTDARIRMARILAKQGRMKEARELLQRLRINAPQQGLRLFLIEAELLRNAKRYADANAVFTRALELFPDNPDLLYARALNAADMHRIDILEQDLKKILAKQPNHADALNALGYTLADQTDRLQEAKSYIERALALKPDNAAILDSMGWLEYRLGHLQKAREYLQRAVKQNPDAEIASHLGEVLWKLGKKREALAVWRKANQRDPGNRFINPVMRRLGVDH